jgi:hypothetical protein
VLNAWRRFCASATAAKVECLDKLSCFNLKPRPPASQIHAFGGGLGGLWGSLLYNFCVSNVKREMNGVKRAGGLGGLDTFC